jgi:excinuclease UvrABC helicase subunit UvrB
VNRYARREEDKLFLEKWRPYILRVHATAGIMIELEKKAYDEALKHAQAALQQLEELTELDDETFEFERERSRTALSELAVQIRKNRPLSELEQLEQQLRQAVERQEFESAAQLRDRIRTLKHQPLG